MYCILGQGLAGTILAFRLKASGIPFKIIDNGFKDSSSIVAAGLWNPIVFRRINKSYMADEFLNELEIFYPEIEKLLGEKFFHPIEIGRVHATKWERDTWFEKIDLPTYKGYLSEKVPDWEISDFQNMPFGSNLVQNCGHLNTELFLRVSRKYFEKEKNLIEAHIELPVTISGMEQWTYSGIKFDKIIDCRGYRSAHAKWWKYLPFGLTKGETLTIKCPGLNLREVFNAGFFVLPLGATVFKVGATFNWDEPNPEITEEGKIELSEKFEAAIKLPFEIIDHQAGVRPTVQDRRPLFGQHPLADNLYIFNGLGAKGVMMAPYCSKLFVDYLQLGKSLPKDMDIKRFNDLIGKENPEINHPVR